MIGRMSCLVLAALALSFVLAGSAAAAGNPYPPDPTCQTNGVVRTILYLDGVAYLGGDFTQAAPAGVVMGGRGTVGRAHLAACSEKTGALLKWNPGANDRVMSLARRGSTIYAGGLFTRLAGKPRSRIGALTRAGKATAFNPGANHEVFVVRTGPNGNLFAGGAFSKLAGTAAARVGELTPGGKRVTWHVAVGQVAGLACPPRCPPRVFAIAFSGQTVYLGGHFGTVNGVSRNEMAAVGLKTGVLTAFNPNIYAPANCPTCQTVETARVLTVIPNAATHAIYACGGFWRVNGNKLAYDVGAFNPTTGALDPKFTIGDDGDTLGCAIRNNVLYMGGHFNYIGPLCLHNSAAPCQLYHHVAAANILTNTLLPWNPGANSSDGIYTIRADATHVGFGGFQTHFAGHQQQGYASYSAAKLP